MDIFENIKKDYYRDLEYHSRCISSAMERYEKWEDASRIIPKFDFDIPGSTYFTVHCYNTISIGIPWNIALADRMGLELEKKGWELVKTSEREPSDVSMTFTYEYVIYSANDDNTTYTIEIRLCANEYKVDGQACKLVKVGEEVKERIIPIYKIECEDPEPIP
jgi:hypothetical protein